MLLLAWVPTGALADELRPEAASTLAALQRAGVRPKIISGDDPDTVGALAVQAGLDPGSARIAVLPAECGDQAQSVAEGAHAPGRSPA